MTEAIKLDTEIATKQFVARYVRHQGNQIDNSTLPAGCNMIYYCRHCGIHTQTLPESHFGRPKTICTPCEVLDAHGLIPDAIEAAQEAKRNNTPIDILEAAATG